VEPLAIIRAQGVRAKTFYTAYQGYIYGIAVPQNSAIKRFADLKGKSIGVASMGSAGVVVARALAANAGLDPDRDIRIVVAGEGVQPAVLLRSGQVDALSQYDTQYAMVENAGTKLRLLPSPEIERFPSNGLVALEDTLSGKRKQSIALAQAYAKGTLFAIANPEAAIRMMWDVYPQSRSTGKDEATALREEVSVLQARIQNWKLEKGSVSKWGESSERNYAAYVDFLHKWGILKEKIPTRDLITNDLIAEKFKLEVKLRNVREIDDRQPRAGALELLRALAREQVAARQGRQIASLRQKVPGFAHRADHILGEGAGDGGLEILGAFRHLGLRVHGPDAVE
jgi:NitT/TauT family transport system substrate-binding protein